MGDPCSKFVGDCIKQPGLGCLQKKPIQVQDRLFCCVRRILGKEEFFVLARKSRACAEAYTLVRRTSKPDD